MADCPEFVIWDLIPPGSKLCAEASAIVKDGTTPSNDFNATLKINPPNQDDPIRWIKADLSPGPKSLTLVQGGYGCTGKITSGPNGPTVTLHAWIETPAGTKPFDCTWTNSTANKEYRITITLAVVTA